MVGGQEVDKVYLGGVEIWSRGGGGNAPLYKLAGNASGLPLGSGETTIPSIGTASADFIAKANESNVYNNDPQIWSLNDSIYMAHESDITQTNFPVNDTEEFTIKYKYSDLQRDAVASPRHGYAFMTAGRKTYGSDGYLDVFLDEDDGVFYIVLSRGDGPPTLDVSGHNTGTSANALKFYDINFAWLQNNGAGREFTICMKNNVLYFYIDGVLYCHQTYGRKYGQIMLGTRWQPTSPYGGYGTACVKIDNFEIYDKFLPPA